VSVISNPTGSVRTTAALLAVVFALLHAGCGSKGDGDGTGAAKGGSKSVSGMTVDQFRDAVTTYTQEYAKQHPNTKDFGETPTKDEFYAKFGNPDRVSEVGDDAYLYYRTKDGMARIQCNKGVFSHYKRVHVVAVEQAS
jgi:hypothetical protein